MFQVHVIEKMYKSGKNSESSCTNLSLKNKLKRIYMDQFVLINYFAEMLLTVQCSEAFRVFPSFTSKQQLYFLVPFHGFNSVYQHSSQDLSNCFPSAYILPYKTKENSHFVEAMVVITDY